VGAQTPHAGDAHDNLAVSATALVSPQPAAGLGSLAVSRNGLTIVLRARQRGQFSIIKNAAWIVM